MMQDAINAIQQFGFPIVMAVGMGYYIYYIWKYVTEEVSPKLEESHLNLIKVIDQIRMLDNDLIRLQQKVNVVLEYKATQKILEDAKKTEALEKVERKKK